MSARIFISYRTADGVDKAAALARDLGVVFGDEAVFLDKDDLRGGSAWRNEIHRALDARPVLLLLVTPQLISAVDSQGLSRLAGADDPVRWELEIALEAGARVIPVLCDGLKEPPDAGSLPPPVIHAYEEWGIEGFSRLNGMYGLALWDRRRKELVLARDPFGVKPLYYTDQQGSIVFGSEIKAILADPNVSRSVDLAALDQFLTFSFVPSPRTMFEGIKKVPPGYALCVTSEGSRQVRFYQPIITTPKMSGTEWLEALQDGIEKAIVRQMVADVPVGVMLRGGMDSATVAMLARKHSGQPIHSFSVGFSEDFEKDELALGRRSAELIGTTHHEVII